MRQATGLVREFSYLDTLWLALAFYSIFFEITFVPSTATLVGGNVLEAALLAFVGAGAIGLAFSIISYVTPRTAGDYVFTTRFLNPSLGFVGNAGFFLANAAFTGVNMTIALSIGFEPLLTYLGYATNNPGLLSASSTLASNPYLGYGLMGLLTLIFALFAFRTKGFRIFNYVVSIFIVAVVLVMFGLLASTSQAHALQSLQTLTGNSSLVSKVNAWGAVNNSPLPTLGGITPTLALMANFAVGMSVIYSPVYIGGEVKKASKNIPLAILTLLVIGTFWMVAATLISYNVFGFGFLSNLYDSSIFYGLSPFNGVIPYFNFLGAAVSPSVVLGSLFLIAAIVNMLQASTNLLFVNGRILLSYSFDRIMPSFLGDVSDKYHVPVKALATSLIVGLLFGIAFFFPVTSGVAFLLSSAIVALEYLFPVLIVGFALIVFRFRFKDRYVSSGLAKSWLGGPAFWIAAIGTIVFTVAIEWQYLTVSALFGYAGTEGYELIIVPVVAMFVVYFIARYINQRRGVPFDLIFKEIPPE